MSYVASGFSSQAMTSGAILERKEHKISFIKRMQMSNLFYSTVREQLSRTMMAGNSLNFKLFSLFISLNIVIKHKSIKIDQNK